MLAHVERPPNRAAVPAALDDTAFWSGRLDDGAIASLSNRKLKETTKPQSPSFREGWPETLAQITSG
jgi:hypothetical protein